MLRSFCHALAHIWEYWASSWDYGTLSHRRPAKAQVSLCIREVSQEPLLFAHMKYESRQRVRPKIRHLARLDGCACSFEEWVYWWNKSTIISWDGSIMCLHCYCERKPFLNHKNRKPLALTLIFSEMSTGLVAQSLECQFRGTGSHGFNPRPQHTKVVKNSTSCSSLGTQTYRVELWLVDPVSG